MTIFKKAKPFGYPTMFLKHWFQFSPNLNENTRSSWNVTYHISQSHQESSWYQWVHLMSYQGCCSTLQLFCMVGKRSSQRYSLYNKRCWQIGIFESWNGTFWCKAFTSLLNISHLTHFHNIADKVVGPFTRWETQTICY